MGMVFQELLGECSGVCVRDVGWKNLCGNVFQELGCGNGQKNLREKRCVESLLWERVPRVGWGNAARVCVGEFGWKDLGGNVFQSFGGEMCQVFVQETLGG